MTDQEREVFMALIRLVLTVEARTNDDTHESFDFQVSKDVSLLNHYHSVEEEKKS